MRHKKRGRSVSRVLSADTAASYGGRVREVTIYLDPASPQDSSDLTRPDIDGIPIETSSL